MYSAITVPEKTHYVDAETVSSNPPEELQVFTISAPATRSSQVKCSVVEGTSLVIEVDARTEVSVILEYNTSHSSQSCPLTKPVWCWTSIQANPCLSWASFMYKCVTVCILRLVLVGGSEPTFLGRDWLKSLGSIHPLLDRFKGICQHPQDHAVRPSSAINPVLLSCFPLVTDHKHLTVTLGRKDIPPSAAATPALLVALVRMTSWPNPPTHTNADGLSRLPLLTDAMNGHRK